MSKKIYILAGIALLLLALYLLWGKYRYVLNDQPKLSNKNYSQVLDSIKTIKQKLRKDRASTAVYGTKWNFYGTTQKPNEGTIACGYFVTTTLRDMGVPINRVKMAQCASEEMIRSLCTKKHIHHLSNLGIPEFEKQLKKFGNGLYVVGLDNHTGFLLLSTQGNYFIHASGIYPFQVVKDKLSESPLLIKSKYRVVGKISGDEVFLRKWVGHKN
jgi:hypothetical protein